MNRNDTGKLGSTFLPKAIDIRATAKNYTSDTDKMEKSNKPTNIYNFEKEVLKKESYKNWHPSVSYNYEEPTKAKDNTILPPNKVVRDAINKKIIEKQKREITILKSDIAYAIGHAQGCGHPVKYLEKKYPELVYK